MENKRVNPLYHKIPRLLTAVYKGFFGGLIDGGAVRGGGGGGRGINGIKNVRND